MMRYSLALVLLTALFLNAQTKSVSKDVNKTQAPKVEQHIEVLDKNKQINKSTLEVEVVKYSIPNNSEVSFPVTVRKNTLEGDE